MLNLRRHIESHVAPKATPVSQGSKAKEMFLKEMALQIRQVHQEKRDERGSGHVGWMEDRTGQSVP